MLRINEVTSAQYASSWILLIQLNRYTHLLTLINVRIWSVHYARSQSLNRVEIFVEVGNVVVLNMTSANWLESVINR